MVGGPTTTTTGPFGRVKQTSPSLDLTAAQAEGAAEEPVGRGPNGDDHRLAVIPIQCNNRRWYLLLNHVDGMGLDPSTHPSFGLSLQLAEEVLLYPLHVWFSSTPGHTTG